MRGFFCGKAGVVHQLFEIRLDHMLRRLFKYARKSQILKENLDLCTHLE